LRRTEADAFGKFGLFLVERFEEAARTVVLQKQSDTGANGR
jgi:hypothetical protein